MLIADSIVCPLLVASIFPARSSTTTSRRTCRIPSRMAEPGEIVGQRLSRSRLIAVLVLVLDPRNDLGERAGTSVLKTGLPLSVADQTELGEEPRSGRGGSRW